MRRREETYRYVNLWLKHLDSEGLIELEKEIEMPLYEFATDILEETYQKYVSKVPSVSIELDNYSDYIIAPKNGSYSLDDFLLNRLLRSITEFKYINEKYTTGSSYYYHTECKVKIDKNRIENVETDPEQKRKVVAHEILHAMKTQFFDGSFAGADRYFLMKEELKSIFGSEINDFDAIGTTANEKYKHSGVLIKDPSEANEEYGRYDSKLIVLDEALNEKDSLQVSNINKPVGRYDIEENQTILIRNPSSSNFSVTNYAYIIERLLDDKTMFEGQYIRPLSFFEEFDRKYTPIFRSQYNSDSTATKILSTQLCQILSNDKTQHPDIEKHIKLLNTLYLCAERKYVFEDLDEEWREKTIRILGKNGIFTVSDNKISSNKKLFFSEEFEKVREKISGKQPK